MGAFGWHVARFFPAWRQGGKAAFGWYVARFPPPVLGGQKWAGWHSGLEVGRCGELLVAWLLVFFSGRYAPGKGSIPAQHSPSWAQYLHLKLNCFLAHASWWGMWGAPWGVAGAYARAWPAGPRTQALRWGTPPKHWCPASFGCWLRQPAPLAPQAQMHTKLPPVWGL